MTSRRLAVRIFDVTVLSRELKAILTRLYFPRAILTVYRSARWRANFIYLLCSSIIKTRRCTESRNNFVRNYLRFQRRGFSVWFHLATKLQFPHRYDTIRYDIASPPWNSLLARNFDTRRVLYGINRVCSVETAHPRRPRVTGALNLR